MWIAVAGSVAFAVLAVVAELRRPLNPDAAWLLYCADSVLRGDRLYVDLLEINPPLIVWLNLPVAALAQATGLSGAAVFRAAVLLAVAASCAVCGALAARFPGEGWAERRWSVMAAVGFTLLPLVGGSFGQREHIALALLLPVIGLTALRVAGGTIPTAGAVVIGAAGALGMALKPHYAAVWLLLLTFRWLATRDRGRRWHPEDPTVVAAGVFYVLLVLLVTPAYLPLVAGVARDYLGYGARPLAYVLVNDSPAIWFYVALAGWLLLGGRRSERPLSGALAVAGCGFLLAIAAQHKGWSYHYVPLTGCAFLLGVATLWPVPREEPQPRGVGWGLYAVLVLAFAGGWGWAALDRATGPLTPREVRQLAVRAAVRQQSGARTVLVLSSQLRDAFPLVNDTGLRWSGGYPNMWLSLVYYPVVPGDGKSPVPHAPEAMSAGEHAAFERTVRDLATGRPDLLLVESPVLNERRTGFVGGFDFLGYFGQDPSAAAALAEYHRVAEVDGIWLMRRVGSAGTKG